MRSVSSSDLGVGETRVPSLGPGNRRECSRGNARRTEPFRLLALISIQDPELTGWWRLASTSGTATVYTRIRPAYGRPSEDGWLWVLRTVPESDASVQVPCRCPGNTVLRETPRARSQSSAGSAADGRWDAPADRRDRRLSRRIRDSVAREVVATPAKTVPTADRRRCIPAAERIEVGTCSAHAATGTPRRSPRPGVAPVWRPWSTTTTPFTSTMSMPSG